MLSPLSLEVFREAGIWDLIFSENFFYFGPAAEDLSGDTCMSKVFPGKHDMSSAPNISNTNSQSKTNGVEILQTEVISFVEFVATSVESSHNLV